jgi:hypothetical protein
MDLESTPQPKRRRQWRKLGVALVLMLVSYVLSVGPAYYLAFKVSAYCSPRTSENMWFALALAYAPLGWLPEQQWLSRYTLWWMAGDFHSPQD